MLDRRLVNIMGDGCGIRTQSSSRYDCTGGVKLEQRLALEHLRFGRGSGEGDERAVVVEGCGYGTV